MFSAMSSPASANAVPGSAGFARPPLAFGSLAEEAASIAQ